jgi:two-component system, LytTR family, response regulator
VNIRTLIVDDEPPARELISTLLREEPDIELIGECGNGPDAVTAIQKESPDLVFVDVQMPGLDGFEVLSALGGVRLPLIVFVTAYDKHALKAFEVHALDYLLKPFEYARLHEAVQRAREHLQRKPSEAYQERLLGLIQELRSQGEPWERLVIRESGRVLFLKIDEIDWIEGEGNYLRLHVGKSSHLLRETMGTAEARLAPKKFLRLSRSTLVNLERVKEWQPLLHGDSVVVLHDGTRLTVTRVYRERFDRLVARLA